MAVPFFSCEPDDDPQAICDVSVAPASATDILSGASQLQR